MGKGGIWERVGMGEELERRRLVAESGDRMDFGFTTESTEGTERAA